MALEILDSTWENLIAGETPIVMDFWAEWCGPCRAIAPIVEEIAHKYEGKVIIGKVNVDDNPNITMNFGIKNIPTLIFMKGGEIVDKHVGAIRKEDLEEKVQKLL